MRINGTKIFLETTFGFDSVVPNVFVSISILYRKKFQLIELFSTKRVSNIMLSILVQSELFSILFISNFIASDPNVLVG